MKALFLVFHGLSPTNGISKKIQAQVKALNDCGVNTNLCYYDIDTCGNRMWRLDNGTIVERLGNGLTGKLKKRFCYQNLFQYIIINQISFIYIRSDHNANPFTIHFVKKLRKAGITTVMEIPTYPYDQEYITFESKCHLFIDKLFRKSLAAQVSRIITFSDKKEIFGQRTIQISNGIDFDSIPLKKTHPPRNDIHLIGVAEIHYWHGYDRLVAGMADYYRTYTDDQRKVYFHLVGDFSGERERNEILPLIENNKLEKYVILHGPLYGDDLDKLFDLVDIGIGSLARHRSNVNYIKTLKNREYAARGIPFIYSEIDDDFEMMLYVMKVSADETQINIDRLILFYDQLTFTPQEIRESTQNLAWEKQIQKTLDKLFND